MPRCRGRVRGRGAPRPPRGGCLRLRVPAYGVCLRSCLSHAVNPLQGGYCGGVPPLPIPNREVKPACADGTAMQCGRVGGRRLFFGDRPLGRWPAGPVSFPLPPLRRPGPFRGCAVPRSSPALWPSRLFPWLSVLRFCASALLCFLCFQLPLPCDEQ